MYNAIITESSAGVENKVLTFTEDNDANLLYSNVVAGVNDMLSEGRNYRIDSLDGLLPSDLSTLSGFRTYKLGLMKRGYDIHIYAPQTIEGSEEILGESSDYSVNILVTDLTGIQSEYGDGTRYMPDGFLFDTTNSNLSIYQIMKIVSESYNIDNNLKDQFGRMKTLTQLGLPIDNELRVLTDLWSSLGLTINYITEN